MTYLGRGMTFESQPGIGLRHSLAIVDDLYRRASGVDHRHVDMARSGIHGVLHQFLYDTGRTLYHLTGRYLVGHGIGQELDNIRHTLTFELCLFWCSLSRAFHRHFLSVVAASPRRQAISAKEAHGAATP